MPPKSEPVKQKKQPSELSQLFTMPKKGPTLYERRAAEEKERLNREQLESKRSDKYAANEKLEAQHSAIKKALESLAYSQQIKVEAFPKTAFKCLKLNDGSTYYGQVQQILPLHFKPDTSHTFPAGFKKHVLNKNFSSGSGV